MAAKGLSLAARLKAAMERDQSVQLCAEEERLARIEAGRAARNRLFLDLLDFGKELPFLKVSRKGDEVTFAMKDRVLSFSANPDASSVDIDFTGRAASEEHRLYREAAMDERWIWVRTKRKRDDRLVFFDRGLELLMVHALHLPAPDETPPDTRPAERASPLKKRHDGNKRSL